METAAITTVVKMMEKLPETVQDRVVAHLRDYLEDIQDEALWDAQFAKSQPRLAEAARRAREEIAQGKAAPLDYDRL